MKLRSNLGFLGNTNDKIISVQLPGTNGKTLKIKPEEYGEFISFLRYLNKTNKSKKRLSATQEEYLQFLESHNLVYKKVDLKQENNPRLLNFVNNFMDTTDRYLFSDKVKNKVAVIIGLGTLGTSMLYYLIQMGVTNFVLIDGDKVEHKNLSHQHYYTEKDIGKYKVEALKNRLLDNHSLNIKTESNYLSDKKQLDNLVANKDKKNTYVFCAFDNLGSQLLQIVREINDIYPTYIAGYNRKLVFATIVSNSFLEDYEEEVKDYDVIKDNSEMGFLGDLTALLMLRLWLQKMLSKLDYGWDYLEYSLFDNESSIFSHYLTNKKLNINDKTFFFKFVLDSHLNNLYSQYLLSGNEDNIEEIKAISENFNLDIEEINTTVDEFRSKRDSLHIAYSGKDMNIKHFYNEIMPNIIMSSKLAQNLDNCLKKVESETVSLVNKKKKKVRDKYVKQFSNLKRQLPCLASLVREINNTFFPDEEIDFLKYKPQISTPKLISLSDQIKKVSLVDNLIPNYSLTQHIEFMNEHNFLKVSKQYKTSFTSFDERYNVSTSFIKQDNNLWGLLTLGHEIGHNYFNSFIENATAKVNMSTLTAETFAFINETLVMHQLMNDPQNNDYSFDLLFYLYRLISVPFSMDLYQKKVFAENETELSWNEIINKRLETITTLFPNKKILNLKYSHHNISMNDNFLFNEAELFLYPRAYLLGLFISSSFINDSNLYITFIEYINNAVKLDISLILEKVFNVSEDEAIENGVMLFRKFLQGLNHNV